MLTLEHVLEQYTSKTLDGRDLHRLASFIPIENWDKFGLSLADGVKAEDVQIKEWTQENILKQLERDVEFGFEKALNQRGISSGLMYEVVKMWMWVLEDELQHMEDYAMYGLPLFKAVAIKYNFDNPIGDDDPSDSKFDE